MSGSASAWTYFALVGSNLFFLLPTVRALQLGAAMRAFLYGTMTIVSGIYHLCKPADGLCLLPYYVHFFLDFLFALTVLMSTLLFLAPFGVSSSSNPRRGQGHEKRQQQQHAAEGENADDLWTHRHRDCQRRNERSRTRGWLRNEKEQQHHARTVSLLESRWAQHTHALDTWLIALNMLVIGVGLALAGPGVDLPFWFVATLAGVNALVVLLAWLLLWVWYRVPPSFDWCDFGIAFVLAGAGIALFLAMDHLPSYVVFHSLWHALSAIGSFYLLETRCKVHSGWCQWDASASGAWTAQRALPAPYQCDHVLSHLS